MPNKKGGKKFKKGKKQSNDDKKLIYKNPKEDQEYGRVISICGNGRFQIECFDGKSRLGILAGNMRKRVWVNNNDIVLISRWEFSTENDKCSIVHKYDDDEVKKLKRDGEFPDNIQLDNEENLISDDMISFDYNDPKEDKSSSEESSSDEDINLDDI